MADVFLGLGSNLGDRIGRIKEALGLLEKSGEMTIVSVSSIYETEPVGVTGQPQYINCVARIATELDPHTLLNMLKAMETAMGRKPETHLRPRPIDLDILLYDDIDLESIDLIIPHTRLKSRRFALEPLLELEPEESDPITGKPFKEFIEEVAAQKINKIAKAEEVWNGPGRSAKA